MDEPQGQFINAYAGQTTLSPIGLAMAVAMGLLVLCLPRQRAIWPFLIMACFVSQAQRVYLLGMNFDLLRILVVCGGIRVFSRNEHAWFRWNRLDMAVLVWSLAATIIPVIRIGPDVLVNRLGNLYDIIGMYFLFRCLIRSFDDVWSIAKCLMWISIPGSMFFAAELLTGHNAFATFGGVPAITVIRDGRLRCQGAFSHSILAGCFWAASLPLFAMGWWRGSRALSIASILAGSFVIFACASATPLSSLAVAIAGVGCFFIRHRLRWVRWGIVAIIVFLQIVMKAPVWHLIARMGFLGGSAWHRFSLVDGAITHFDEWWLMGSSRGTGHWGYYTFDVANVYIVEAIHGGVVLLTLFVLVIATAFGCIGRSWRKVEANRGYLLTVWAVGLCVLIHAMNLFSVSYFGQIWCSWYLTLAMAGSIAQFCVARPVAAARHPGPRGKVVRATAVNTRPALGAR